MKERGKPRERIKVQRKGIWRIKERGTIEFRKDREKKDNRQFTSEQKKKERGDWIEKDKIKRWGEIRVKAEKR